MKKIYKKRVRPRKPESECKDQNATKRQKIVVDEKEHTDFLARYGIVREQLQNVANHTGLSRFCNQWTDDCKTCMQCFEASFISFPKVVFWHTNKNDIDPWNVKRYSSIKRYFKCPTCKHELHTTPSHVTSGKWCTYCARLQLCEEKDCMFCTDASFASHPKSKYWNSDNSKSPRQVFKSSKEKYKFDCDTCNHIFETTTGHVSIGRWCSYCAKKKLCNDESCQMCYNASFASHPKSKHWHPGNPISPRQAFRASNTTYKFTCDECKHVIQRTLNDISSNNVWCGYCAHQRLCENDECQFCLEHSFASHPRAKQWSKTNEKSPRSVFKKSNLKYSFDCECGHTFSAVIGNIVGGSWCPFCSIPGKQLCAKEDCKQCFERSFASHPMSTHWHSTNFLTPIRAFRSSNEKYAFMCPTCNHMFTSALCKVSDGRWCPYCAMSDTEKIVLEWMEEQKYDIVPQKTFDDLRSESDTLYRYDFEILSKKILIEVDGDEHMSKEKTTESDCIKQRYALDNGYRLIRIYARNVSSLERFNWKVECQNAIRSMRPYSLVCNPDDEKSCIYDSIMSDKQ